MGLDLKDPIKNLDTYLDSPASVIDVGVVGDRYFVQILSTGFDSLVNERANALPLIKGRMKYNIAIVLGTKIKGSKIEILRGFYNNNYALTNTYPRFTGIVTSYGIGEDMETNFGGSTDNFTVTVNASSYKTVLENRIAGRKTNKSSWQVFNSTDSSMNNVYSIADQTFDFGMDPKKKATTSSAGTGFGQGGGFGGGRDFGGINVNLV